MFEVESRVVLLFWVGWTVLGVFVFEAEIEAEIEVVIEKVGMEVGQLKEEDSPNAPRQSRTHLHPDDSSWTHVHHHPPQI